MRISTLKDLWLFQSFTSIKKKKSLQKSRQKFQVKTSYNLPFWPGGFGKNLARGSSFSGSIKNFKKWFNDVRNYLCINAQCWGVLCSPGRILKEGGSLTNCFRGNFFTLNSLRVFQKFKHWDTLSDYRWSVNCMINIFSRKSCCMSLATYIILKMLLSTYCPTSDIQ